MWRDILERAKKELEEEGLIKDGKITEKGKKEVEENILPYDKRARKLVLWFWISYLKNKFYETDAEDFIKEVLRIDRFLKEKCKINLLSFFSDIY